MFRTRTKLAVMLAIAVLAITWIAAKTRADATKPEPDFPKPQADSTGLDAATMKAALRTATAEEGHFIDFVMAKVKKRILPADLVESTFEWAQKNPTNTASNTSNKR